MSAEAARRVVTSRIVIFGAAGAGTTTVLETIWRRLKPDQRGQVVRQTLSTDASATYEILPVDLGEVNGLHRRFQLASVPRGAANAGPRRQLLKGVDGVIFVVDSAPERQADGNRALQELADHVASYGRTLAELPLVIVLNKRDRPGAAPSEQLLRPILERLGDRRPPVFEAVATDGRGVLQALSAVARLVAARDGHGTLGVESREGPRGAAAAAAARRPSPPGRPGAPPAASASIDRGGQVVVGAPHPADGAVVVPLVVHDGRGGTRRLTLRLRVEVSADDGGSPGGDA